MVYRMIQTQIVSANRSCQSFWKMQRSAAWGIDPNQKPAFAFQDARLFLQKAIANEQVAVGSSSSWKRSVW